MIEHIDYLLKTRFDIEIPENSDYQLKCFGEENVAPLEHISLGIYLLDKYLHPTKDGGEWRNMTATFVVCKFVGYDNNNKKIYETPSGVQFVFLKNPERFCIPE